ncbi:triphosphoribosyl-dephospho-CoA synthase, partial [Hansschlegelia zhihuaiae]|uniref:triphosphoribosyl-dephospho-CoA synthase n=1 Tax=Hansschlegelia zhihuaiae TaxID=405005 RepID=UPI001FE21DCD
MAGVARAFREACRAELHALKPGNVHVFREGHGMTAATFERAAEVAAVRLVAG